MIFFNHFLFNLVHVYIDGILQSIFYTLSDRQEFKQIIDMGAFPLTIQNFNIYIT